MVSATGDELPGLRRTRTPLFVGVAAALVVVIGGAVLLRSSAPSGRVQGVGTSAPTVTQAVVTTAPVVTASSAPTVAPSASVSAAPTSTALSVNSLPDADDKDKKKVVPAGPVPAVAPSGKAADPDKPIKRVSTDKVPIFTNPGF